MDNYLFKCVIGFDNILKHTSLINNDYEICIGWIIDIV